MSVMEMADGNVKLVVEVEKLIVIPVKVMEQLVVKLVTDMEQLKRMVKR